MFRQLVSRIWYESQHHSCIIYMHPYIICSNIYVHIKNLHKKINMYFYYFHKHFWDLSCSFIKFLLVSLKCYIVFYLIIIFKKSMLKNQLMDIYVSSIYFIINNVVVHILSSCRSFSRVPMCKLTCGAPVSSTGIRHRYFQRGCTYWVPISSVWTISFLFILDNI